MKTTPEKQTIYQIKVGGSLDQRWERWFQEMQISTEIDEDGNLVTVLIGPVIDQVALRGLVTRIWDLNLELISVQRIQSAYPRVG